MDEQEVASYLSAYLEAQRQHADSLRWMETRQRAFAQWFTEQAHTQGWLPAELHFSYGPVAQQETTHMCPAQGELVTSCCGRTPFELPRADRMTLDAQLVTCPTSGTSPTVTTR